MGASEPRLLVLASASPQRRAILARLGVEFEVRPTGVQELSNGDPAAVALENALRKARAARDPARSELVLGVDTLVELDGRIYGKPADAAEARATLAALAGERHTVISGLALLQDEQERTTVAVTRVHFRELAPETIEWYLSTGEWLDRAGAYAIQGVGAALVRAIEGDYENVVGLPLAALLDLHPGLIG
ncbi:MAG TPA: nucleoside triphosphate pyrophosphatase [Solirubrobacteraceae bacterium]|nr:nucleoside triphosphate pyrophosphatase [Solirubrobacteraceae bacterium]